MTDLLREVVHGLTNAVRADSNEECTKCHIEQGKPPNNELSNPSTSTSMTITEMPTGTYFTVNMQLPITLPRRANVVLEGRPQPWRTELLGVCVRRPPFKTHLRSVLRSEMKSWTS